jgi:hypothetical protein
MANDLNHPAAAISGQHASPIPWSRKYFDLRDWYSPKTWPITTSDNWLLPRRAIESQWHVAGSIHERTSAWDEYFQRAY